jgi:ADP-ribose pyrophosphatase YjhB (NUDIX family)
VLLEFKKYVNRTIGAGILPITPSGKILIGLRSKECDCPHTWAPFGGKAKSKNMKKEALREFREETGFEGDLDLFPAYVYEDEKLEFHNFIGLLDEFKPKLDHETDEAKWVTYTELKQLSPKHFGLIALLKNTNFNDFQNI